MPAAAQAQTGVRMVPPPKDGERYWPRWAGSGRKAWSTAALRRHLVGDHQRALADAGARLGTLVADRLGRSDFPDHVPRRRRRLSLLSFRRSDGTLLWETDAPEGRVERHHGKNTPASATPTTDGERVYASFGSRGLLAVDFDGSIVWQRDRWAGSKTTTARPARRCCTATPSSSIRTRGLVRSGRHQPSAAGAFVIAVDAESGETRWRTDRSASVGWGTPIAISLGDHDELIVSSSRDVRSYDPTTGDELWSCDGTLFEVIPTPVVGHGLVFCTSGRGAGPTLAIRPGGRGNVTESHVEWKTTRGSPFVPSPVLYGGAGRRPPQTARARSQCCCCGSMRRPRPQSGLGAAREPARTPPFVGSRYSS